MDFYKKNGAGRPTIEEQALIDGIKRVVAEKGINPDAIPPCSTIDDLIYAKQFVDELDNHPDRVQFEEDFEEDEQPFEETDLVGSSSNNGSGSSAKSVFSNGRLSPSKSSSNCTLSGWLSSSSTNCFA